MGSIRTFIGKIKNQTKDIKARDFQWLYAFIGEVFNLWVWWQMVASQWYSTLIHSILVSETLINGFNVVNIWLNFYGTHNSQAACSYMSIQVRPSKTLWRCSRKTFIALPSFMKVASPSTTISIRFPAYHHLFPHHPSISRVALWDSFNYAPLSSRGLELTALDSPDWKSALLSSLKKENMAEFLTERTPYLQ